MKYEPVSDEIIRSERVDFAYEKIRLANGLTVLVAPMKGYRTANAAYATAFGSVDQRFVLDGEEISLPAGVAHFLEHKMFESEEGDAFDRYAETGANANAYTGFERTCYVFGASDRVDESLDILLDTVSHPWFTEATVAKEQGIIGQEIRMYEDSPDWRLMFSVFDCLYFNCPLKQDIAGSVESIAKITPQLLYTCTRAFYNPSNMVLAVAGNITRDQVLAALDRADLPQGGAAVQKLPASEPEQIRERGATVEMAVSRPVLGLGFKERPRPAAERLRWEIMADLLGELLIGDITPLYRRLYDEGLVNSGFSTDVFIGEGYFCILFSGETRDPGAVRAALLDEIARLRREGIRQEDFELCRNLLYGEAVGGFESAESVAGALASLALRGEDLFAELELLATLTVEDLEGALKELLDEGRSATVLLRPAQSEDNGGCGCEKSEGEA